MNLHKTDQWLLFLLIFFFFGYFIKVPDGNINSRLGLVKAMVEQGDFSIDSYHHGILPTDDKAFANGHYFTDKAIGASLLGAAVYAPIHMLAGSQLPLTPFIMLTTLLAISLPCALLGPLVFTTAWKLTGQRWVALTVALAICLGTPVFPYAGAFYGHSLAAMLAFAAFFVWLEVNHFGAAITPTRSLLGGLLIGLLVLTEYPALLIALFLAAYAIWTAASQKMLADVRISLPFILGGGLALAALMLYNQNCFGSPFVTGYSNENSPLFREIHQTGLLGIGWPSLQTLVYMTIHPMEGIFLQSPVLLLALAGFFPLWRERRLRVEAIVISLVIVVYFGAISGFKLWWGGDAFTVRHIIPILPFFVLPLVLVSERWNPLTLILGLISFAQMLIADATTFTYLDNTVKDLLRPGFTFRWDSSLVFSQMLPHLLKNKLTYSWGGYLLGLQSWYLNIAVLMLAVLGALAVFYFTGRRQSQVSD